MNLKQVLNNIVQVRGILAALKPFILAAWAANQL